MNRDGLYVGYSRVDITPEHPMELVGYVSRRNKLSRGVHDRIYCRSLALSQNGTTVIIASCDLLGLSQEFINRVKERLSSFIEDPGNIMISTTHTHSAPATMFFRRSGNVSADYLKFVEEKLVESIKEALGNLSPAALSVTQTWVSGMCINRVNPRLPIDDRIISVRFRADNVQVVLINFQCHPTTLGPENSYVSADFPYYIYEYYSKKGVEAMFINGAAGDVNPRVSGFQGAQELGISIVKSLDGDGNYVSINSDIKINRRTIEVKLKSIGVVSLLSKLVFYAMLRKIRANDLYIDAMYDWAKELFSRKRLGNVQSEITVEITGLRLSRDVAIVSCPCELSSSLGLLIRDRSPFRYTMIASYTNGLIGYILSKDEFRYSKYEAEIAPRFYDLLPFEADSGVVVAEAMLSVLNNLRNP